MLGAELAGSSQCDKNVLSTLFLVTLSTQGSSCSHPALLLVLEPLLPPFLGQIMDLTSWNGERPGNSALRKMKGTGEF